MYNITAYWTVSAAVVLAWTENRNMNHPGHRFGQTSLATAAGIFYLPFFYYCDCYYYERINNRTLEYFLALNNTSVM